MPLAGQCTAAGYYGGGDNQHAFVVTQHNGVWHAAQRVPGITTLTKPGEAVIDSLSCASAGNCSADGTFTTTPLTQKPFTVTQTAGTWHTAQEIRGISALPNSDNAARIEAVSCPPTGPCVSVGTYKTHHAVGPPEGPATMLNAYQLFTTG